MLDGGSGGLTASALAEDGLPLAIVVGRTPSSFTVSGIQNQELTITYTVYNEQANTIDGVLLTTTLQPGVTFKNATAPPNRLGQELAWSLGSIAPYGSVSVDVMMTLPASVPSPIDSGARAFGTVNARSVSDAAPALSLRAGSIDAALLASTPDANAADPFIREQAARLDYDPQAIFDDLHTQIGYESYRGSVRGARGTLWSEAGNSLDVASLGVALMRASGIPAQYAAGTLTTDQARSLVLSMFPDNTQAVGSIPSGTIVSDPANDFQLINEARDHYWFRFDSGGGMTDADPLMPGATVGQTFTPSTSTFAEVPDALREKTTIQLSVETYSQAGALFGFGDGLSTTVVLERTFNDVELVGRPITIGNFVSTTNLSTPIFAARTMTYTPYFAVGDQALPTAIQDEPILGTSFQETLTNFPFGTQVLTGLFLKVTLSGPNGGSETFDRELVDRIGYAARRGLSPTNVSVDPNGPPALSDLDVFTLSVLPGRENPVLSAPLTADLNDVGARLTALQQNGPLPAEASALARRYVTDLTRSFALNFAQASGELIGQFASVSKVAAYFDRPRLILASSKGVIVDDVVTPSFSIDLRRNEMRVIAHPGQNEDAIAGFRMGQGVLDTGLEGALMRQFLAFNNRTAVVINTAIVFEAANAQNIPILVLTRETMGRLDTLPISADAKARITASLLDGEVVTVPARPVDLGSGVLTTAWYETDPSTGETIGVTEDGGHQGLTEFVVRGALAGLLIGGTLKLLIWGANYFDNPQLAHQIQGVGKGLGIISVLLGFGSAYEESKGSLTNIATHRAAYGPALAFVIAGILIFALVEPPLPNALFDPALPPPNDAETTLTVSAGQAVGAVTGEVRSTGVSVSGPVSASWSSSAVTAFLARTVNAVGATVRNASGATVGSGTVVWNGATLAALTASGNVNYAVNGTGRLSFHGPSEGGVGMGGDWQGYTATLSGTVTLQLTTDGLTLNGQTLAAGTYTITADAATLTGSGASASPTFSGSAVVSATNGTVWLDPATGNLAVGGNATDPANGITITGYSGTIVVTGNDTATDAIAFQGSAAQVLRLGSSGATLTTDQNTPVTFRPDVLTSLAGTYTLTVQAPTGWSVSIDAAGNVTAKPKPGLQGGIYPLQIVARSTTNPDLVTQQIVNIAITPTQPTVTIRSEPDPLFTLPFNGALVPSSFRALVDNRGPATDTFRITSANVPGGFTLITSRTGLTIPAGETGIVGLYLQPNAGQTLPAPGTVLTFNVTATSETDPSVTATMTVTFTVPAIHAITIVSDPVVVNTTPGSLVTATITIVNVGNVAETDVRLAATLPNGLTLTGLPTGPISLAIGQTLTQTVTLTPAANTPLNTIHRTTITARFGTTDQPATQELALFVNVVVPGVAAIANASVAAVQLGKDGLVERLNDLSLALTNLVQDPTNAVSRGQAVANLDSLISQLTSDPFLSGFTNGLTTARTALVGATSPAETQAAVANLGTALDSLAGVIIDVAQHGFTLALSPERAIVQPGAPLVFTLLMTNNGSVTTTYDLSVAGLPPGVTATFSQSSVTLQPGQSITAGSNAVTLTITETGDTLVPANFTVVATARTAPEITQRANGQLTLRDQSVLVAGIVATPSVTDAGGMVSVTARVLGTVNQPTEVSASFTVRDASGQIVFTSASVPFSINPSSGLLTVDLGTVDTTGFADGIATILVTLTPAGGTVPSSAAAANLFIGQPVTGGLTTTPAVVPTGSETVTTSVTVTTQTVFPDPLTLLGAVSVPAPATSVAIHEAGGRTYAYESGTGGIAAIDVTDPTQPSLIRMFGQGDITNGQFGFNIARVVQGVLLVGTSNGNNGSVFNLLAYSLADPANPSLISNTTINYRFLSDMLVNSTGTAVYVPTNGFYYSGNSIFQNFGNFVSIDLSNPTQPILGDALFNNRPLPDGGDMNQFGGTLINDQIAYSAGITPGGNTIIGNKGNILVVNIADPTDISLIRQLQIPGTINVIDVAAQGNRALVIGTAGQETNIVDFNAKGVANHLTLTLLDITDPADPQILGSTFVASQQFPLNEAGGKVDAVSLGNGLFAVSGTYTNGNPSLVVVDPSDPDRIVVGATQVPSGVRGITVLDDTLYASTASGLSIYEIHPLVSEQFTVSVSLPAGAAVDIASDSFNIAPTQILTGATEDTLIWSRAFAAGSNSYTFSWQSKVSGVDGGEVVPVTLGATVTYVNQGNPGSLSLPGTSVTGVSVINVTPASLSEQPGGSATYNVRLTNPTAAPVTYSLSTTGLPFGIQASLPFSVPVPANGSVDVPLTLTSSSFTQPGEYPFSVSARFVRFAPNSSTILGDYQGSAPSRLTIAGTPVVVPDDDAHGVAVTLIPTASTAGLGTPATYVVRVTNVGSTLDFFNLSVDGLPPEIVSVFGPNGGFVEVPPGAGNFRDITLTLISSFNINPGTYPFTVTAASTSNASITSSAAGTLLLTADGVRVRLSPVSTTPGSSLQMTVTNTGTVSGTYDLSLGGPAALAASLGAMTEVTLEPGQSRNIPIATNAVNYALAGSLDLVAIARVRGNPSIGDTDNAELTIAATQGLTASFDPPTQVLPTPGLASFLLSVQNTGNAEDAYSVTIVGINGPVTASLVGLDGQPTQTIPVIRLTGLSSGAIALRANLTALGPGTVTVRVQSINDPSRTATVTATVSATADTGQPATIATTTQVTAQPNMTIVGQAVTLVAVIGVASGSNATPTGTVTFIADGQVLGVAPVAVVGGQVRATLTVTTLTAGTHQVFAAYGGDAAFLPSASNAIPVVVQAMTADTQGPRLVSVMRFGYHAQPTVLMLTFDEALDATQARNVRNYRIVGPGGRAIAIASAVYDAASHSVTLRPRALLNLQRNYRLTINGTSVTGVRDLAGNLLDGNRDGLAGGNDLRVVNRHNLVLGGRIAPRPTRPLSARSVPAQPKPMRPESGLLLLGASEVPARRGFRSR